MGKLADQFKEKHDRMPMLAALPFDREMILFLAEEFARLEAIEADYLKSMEHDDTPKDGDLFDPVEIKHTFDDLVFQPYIWDDHLTPLFEDLEFADALRAEQLEPCSKILVHGPSGVGKSSLAHAIAHRLGWPLYRASLGNMLSKYIGESEKQITQMFRFIAKTKCVFFIDECDSFLTKRAEGGSDGSLSNNRLVNVFLVEMEAVQPAGLVMAATNMAHLLDPAAKARFEKTIEFMRASETALRKIGDKTKRGFDIDVDRFLRDNETPRALVMAIKAEMRRIAIARERAKRAEFARLDKAITEAEERAPQAVLSMTHHERLRDSLELL